MDNVLIGAVQALIKYILQINSGSFIAVAAVVDTLGIFILTGEQRIGNGTGAVGNGGFAQAQIELCLMPQTVAHLTGRLQERIHLGVFFIGA